MSLKVTVLGCSGMYATADRAASGYLLELDNTCIWMDAGAGTWQNLLKIRPYESIDGIILSHRHPDHTSDIFQAFHARHYGRREPLPPIPLWAPEDTLHRVAAFSYDFDNSFDLRPLKDRDVINVNGAQFLFVEMTHVCDTLGVRIEVDGGVFAYSADTGPKADFDSLARSADVFICEATYQNHDEEWEGHMRAAQAGEVAAAAGARKVVLTHVTPGHDHAVSLEEARQTAGSTEVAMAEDGQTFEFGR